jgi:hypothetical protein
LQAEFAPDANYLAYLVPNANDQNVRKLMIANIFQGTEIEYAQGRLLKFGGWNPDGAYFTYKAESEMLQLGHICQAPQPLLDATGVQWVDDQRFVTIIGDERNQAKESGMWDVSTHTIGDLESGDTLHSNLVMQLEGLYPDAIVIR